MIEVILHGRLGNWFFQYAVGRRLALKHGTDLCLNLSERFKVPLGGTRWVTSVLGRLPLRARTCLRPPLLRRYAHRLGLPALARRFYEEPRYGYNAEVLDLPDGACLRGPFQSERYFRDIADVIRDEIVLPATDDVRALQIEEAIRGTTAISVHVRRDDYLLNGWGILGREYYAGIMNHCRERVPGARFFVFSDDVDWCRAHLRGDDCEVVDVPAARDDPFIDLGLMSRCRHHVIANSSYSWWGAWLVPSPGKLVFAPAVWFPHLRDDTRFLDEILCPEWIRWPVPATDDLTRPEGSAR